MNIAAVKDQQYSEPGSLELFSVYAIGATGASTLSIGGRGLNKTTPLTRNGVGDYTLNLIEGVNAILDWNINTQSAGFANTTAMRAVVVAYSASAGTLQFKMVNTATGAATEIISGDKLHIKVTVRNTNASPL